MFISRASYYIFNKVTWCSRNIKYSRTKSGFGLVLLSNVSLLAPLSSNDENEDEGINSAQIIKKITISEPKEFSHTFQLKQAANQAINSSTVMLNRSFQTLLTAYSNYSEMLEAAIKALHRAIEINPLVYANTSVEDQLSMLTSEISSLKSTINETLFLYDESVKLVETAANVSFLVGSEASSSIASSHLYNTSLEVNEIKKKIEILEKEYLSLQKQFIIHSKQNDDN